MTTTWNFKHRRWEKCIIESFQWRPSKCDTVLKCEDGQVHLSRISLVVASGFWRELLSDHEIQSETKTVILIPGFTKESVLEILEFLKKGELKTECCSKTVQRVINLTQVLIPDIDIFSFEIEEIDIREKGEHSDEDTEDTVDFNQICKTAEHDHASKLTKDEARKTVEILDDSENINDQIYSTSFEGIEVGKTKERRHACRFCLKYFVRKSTLDRHIEIVHLKTKTCICTICDREFASNDGLKVHMKTHNESHPSNFKCPDCSKIYTNLSDLDRHCQINGHDYLIRDAKKSNPKFIKCKICHKWVGRMEYHMKKYHSDKSKTFSCDYCNFTTNRRDTLYKHERVSHDQHYRDFKAIQETLKTKTKLKCFDCSKIFETAGEIEKHIALGGCKENKCNDCGKTFNVRHNLLQHIREVHEVTETFECPFCNKIFNQKRGRDRHVKICKKNNMNDVSKVNQ